MFEKTTPLSKSRQRPAYYAINLENHRKWLNESNATDQVDCGFFLTMVEHVI
jgi:hypothetical protein